MRPVIEHHDPVGVADRRQPVGDDDRGAAARGVAQRLLDQLLGHRVEVGRRFVEHQDAGIADDGARDRDPLALAARHHRAALADERVEPGGQRGDHVGQVRGRDRALERPFRDVLPAVEHVLAAACRERGTRPARRARSSDASSRPRTASSRRRRP